MPEKDRQSHHLRPQNLVALARATFELIGDTSPIIDRQFLQMGEREASREGTLFSVIDPSILEGDDRPDSVRHDLALLPPNPLSGEETNNVLKLLEFFVGDQVEPLTDQFHVALSEMGVWSALKSKGEAQQNKFIVVSNHLELPDQGFTMGFLHKAAQLEGIDRLENYLTVLIGRLIGYFNVGNLNAIDDILRKVGSTLKTLPPKGSESLSEDEDDILLSYRGVMNHRTRLEFSELIRSKGGRIICMAPSGEKDKVNSDKHVVEMATFGKGTCEMMIEACKGGAVILPAFVDYGADASIVEFLSPTTVSTLEDCHQIGREIAGAGTFRRAQEAQLKPEVKRFSQPVIYG